MPQHLIENPQLLKKLRMRIYAPVEMSHLKIHNILELSDDSDDDSPLKVKKVPKKGGQKKSKVRPTVIDSESSDDSDDNNKKKTTTANTKNYDEKEITQS